MSWHLSNHVFTFHTPHHQKYFKWFILSELSVLLSWSINKQCQDENQRSLSLTSEGWGLFLMISAEEGPCYSGNSHPTHQLTGLLFSVSWWIRSSIFFFLGPDLVQNLFFFPSSSNTFEVNKCPSIFSLHQMNASILSDNILMLIMQNLATSQLSII